MLSVRLAGQEVWLHSSGALALPAQRVLLVADAHFGKAVSFRRLGVPVPRGTTLGTLDKIDAALAETGADEVIFLGDFLHSARSHAPGTLAALAQWRAARTGLGLTLVRGNHDDRAGDPPAALGFRVVDEPLHLGPFALCHHPRPVPGAYVLAGHWHPCAQIDGRAHERLRLPCFWFGPDDDPAAGDAVGVLPAFGHFTGMHPIVRRPGDRVCVIAGDVVRELPAG